MIIKDPDSEWVMSDATSIKVHAHAPGAACGTQGKNRSTGGSRCTIFSKIHLIEDGSKVYLVEGDHGIQVRIMITDTGTADPPKGDPLIEEVNRRAWRRKLMRR